MSDQADSDRADSDDAAAVDDRSTVDRELERRRLADSWSFEDCCFDAFETVRSAWTAFGSLGELSVEGSLESASSESIGQALAHGAVVPAFLEDSLVGMDGGSDDIGRFAEAIIDISEEAPSVAAAQVLAALNAERAGRDVDAEKLLIEAIELDSACGTAAVELADYCVLRNQLPAAIELLRRSEVGNDSRMARLEAIQEHIATTHRQAGRNDPCTCGSGIKFKQCCAREPKVPTTMQLELVTQKLGSYLTRVHRWHRVVELADAAVPLATEDGPGMVARLSAHPLIHDLACFEGGVAADFLRDRSSFLPADEAALIQKLIDTPRRLWQVDVVRPDGGIELVDVMFAAGGDDVAAGDGGERVTIMDRAKRGLLSVGDRVLGRTADLSGETFMAGIPVTIPLLLHDDAKTLMETDPGAVELATWFASATS